MEMQWDTLIKDALVFDGTGTPPVREDIAIRDGRIAARSAELAESQAREVIDADGQWLMPGLLDIHTHFDLEVEIEPGLPEAVRHGSTTVVVANCSLGLAFGAQRQDANGNAQDPIVDCFARVENVPKHVLRKVADTVDWSDSAGYLDHFDRLALGPNIAPMIPQSMLRIEAMGLKDCISRDPTEDELQHMESLLEKGMQEGYIGFSTDALPFHYLANDPNRKSKIPSQFGSFAELRRMTDVVRRYRRVWQATPPKDSRVQTLRNFLLTSGRFYGSPLKVTAVAALDLVTNKSVAKMALFLSRLLNSRFINGHFHLQALAAPFKVWADGMITPLAEELPVTRLLNETDLEDREARHDILSDPQYIRDFKKMWHDGKRGWSISRIKRWLQIEDPALTRDLKDMIIDDCPIDIWAGESMQAVYERLLHWQSSGAGARTDAEKEAFETAAKPIGDDADFLLYLLRSYDTDLRWYSVTANADGQMMRKLLFHPLILPGFNDSGAHLTNMAFYDGNLRGLQLAAEEGLSQVASMVKRLTRDPAEFFSLDVGTLEIGAQADIILIDPDALSRYDAEASIQYIWRDSFEHKQLVNRSDGVVSRVLIAGHTAWKGDDFGEDLGEQAMGRVLREKSVEAATGIPTRRTEKLAA